MLSSLPVFESPSGLWNSLQVIAGVVLIGVLYSVLTKDRPLAGFPIISIDGLSPKESWMIAGRKTIAKGLEQCSGAFQIITGTGPKIVLPNRFAEEIRNNPDLHLNLAFRKDFFVNYPGFDAQRQGLDDIKLTIDTVRTNLNQSLGLIALDLIDETSLAIHDRLGEDKNWHPIVFKQEMLNLVARVSSRIFLGEELCRNERWIQIAKDYTVDVFMGSRDLRRITPIFRPIAHWFLPRTKALRKAVKDAHELIDPEVERRTAAVKAALSKGEKTPKVADSLGWMYQMANGRKVDLTAGQLSLSLAAIHTTTEVAACAILDICEHPELADQLREEILGEVGENGWTKATIHKLKLMDSWLKESQRYNDMSCTSMNRYVGKRVQLSDGTILPKGSRIMVANAHRDPQMFPEPDKFDPARFLKARQQPGQENSHHLTTGNPKYLLFGHGEHMCPGRFMAATEIKIILCFMLLKYDWRFLPGQGRPLAIKTEQSAMVSPVAAIEVRRREE